MKKCLVEETFSMIKSMFNDRSMFYKNVFCQENELCDINERRNFNETVGSNVSVGITMETLNLYFELRFYETMDSKTFPLLYKKCFFRFSSLYGFPPRITGENDIK